VRAPRLDQKVRSALRLRRRGGAGRKALRRLAGGLAAGLEGLLAKLAAAVDLGGDGFEAALFVGGRGVQHDGAGDGLRDVGGRDDGLGSGDGSGSDFGGFQREGDGAAVVIDGDGVAGGVVGTDNERAAGLVEADPGAAARGGVVDAEHHVVAGGHDAAELDGSVGGGRGFGGGVWREERRRRGFCGERGNRQAERGGQGKGKEAGA